MATTRKILSKVEEKIPVEVETPAKEPIDEGRRSEVIRSKKVCQFCSNKTEPHYFDMVALRRFINDRGRIITRVRSGSCAKHQRRITKEIKRARHLALLPFTVKA